MVSSTHLECWFLPAGLHGQAVGGLHLAAVSHNHGAGHQHVHHAGLRQHALKDGSQLHHRSIDHLSIYQNHGKMSNQTLCAEGLDTAEFAEFILILN